MRRIMQNHKNIIKKSIDYFDYKKNKALKEEFGDLLDSSKRIWENLENQKEMVEVLSSTNDALLNYHISDIMKTLTLFSVIVFPLTLLAAIFGMNTVKGMPFMDTENGFWIIIGIMLLGCLTMLLFFVRKKWL
jgi:magnesium transporter